ncbi:hypothetical protein ACQEVF_38470 [Nonomuraea polychroma]|uniref:hypothetical protein n=1 Tax=Nonomuraea polychroma TaxID=46176 RepID=UPI003D94E4FF
MNENPEELPEAVGGVEGESDVVAERSGAETPKARRPIPAEPPELRDEPEAAEEDAKKGEEETRTGAEEVTRPDAGPTG